MFEVAMILTGDRDDWRRIHDSERGTDDFISDIFIRPALRQYKFGNDFEDCRVAIAEAPERFWTWLKGAFFRLWCARRVILDVPAARRVYRSLRFLKHRFLALTIRTH